MNFDLLYFLFFGILLYQVIEMLLNITGWYFNSCVGY